MRTAVLILWSVCLLVIAASLFRFAWIATPRERLLTLTVLAFAASGCRRPPSDGKNPQ